MVRAPPIKELGRIRVIPNRHHTRVMRPHSCDGSRSSTQMRYWCSLCFVWIGHCKLVSYHCAAAMLIWQFPSIINQSQNVACVILPKLQISHRPIR